MPDIIAHTCNLSTLETKAGGWVEKPAWAEKWGPVSENTKTHILSYKIISLS